LLSGHLDVARARIDDVLALGDEELLAAVAGRRRAAIEAALGEFDAGGALRRLRAARLSAVCRCEESYPSGLRDLTHPPAVLHIAGRPDLLESGAEVETVAIVGSRRASPYGLQVARSLGRSLAAAGLIVVSGMAHGIDSGAHEGALSAGGRTVAILPACADAPYPRSARALHRRIAATGAVASELDAPGAVRRWMFPARNRIIAATARMTVVVEAATGSGALLTAAAARQLGRIVGAVPGRVTSPQSRGCHELLGTGARLIRGPEDVLEALFGADAGAATPPTPCKPALDPVQRTLLDAIASGEEAPVALARVGVAPGEGLAILGWLELAGYLRREAGGAFSVMP